MPSVLDDFGGAVAVIAVDRLFEKIDHRTPHSTCTVLDTLDFEHD
jgi:hypothetical protein